MMSEPTTYAAIDLGALGRNLTAIRQRTGRLVLLPVKANAYGHGLVEVAKAAIDHGWADWLAVATVCEGVALREADVTAPILKLSGALPDETEQAVMSDLRLAITDREGLESARAAAARTGLTARVHLTIDTGMHRIGVLPGEAADMAELIDNQVGVVLDGVFTHLAVADVPTQNEFTQTQLSRFLEAVDGITRRLGRRPGIVHAANSAGVLSHPDSWWDMVRPGILSYGYYPDATTPKTIDVEPVLSLVTHLAHVQTVPAGETIGYGRTWAPSVDTRIGTFPVGYGDGYDRRLSSQVDVLIRGRRYPQVGRVCMDQSMVDLGPGSDIGVGERVTLLGADGDQRIDADEIGGILGTISYEVLSGLAHRIPRVYLP